MNDLAVVPVDPSAAMELAADPGEFVVQCLERGKTWLSEALDHGDLDALVNIKGYAETLRVATMQKQLGHDAELVAAELVRRAERAIGLGIREGQRAGEIRTSGQYARSGSDPDLPGPTDFAKQGDLSGARGDGIYALTDGVTDEEFEQAVSEAKEEGNMSRAHIARKVKKPTDPIERLREDAEKAAKSEPPRNLPVAQRAEQIRVLAARNLTSPQIADEIGLSVERVRELARNLKVEIPADAVFGGRFRKIDPDAVMDSVVFAAMPEPIVLARIAYSELDPDRIDGWVCSLSDAIRSLQTIKRNLQKEQTRDR